MFLMATGDGQQVDVDRLWDVLAQPGYEEVSIRIGVLLGLRLALDEGLLAQALLASFERRAGAAQDVPPEQIEITTRELLGAFLATAEVRAA
jgi:hypothetical protein